MAQLFTAGEQKIRPGVYYRYTGNNGIASNGAMDGVNAIVLKAPWGPVDVVTVHEKASSLIEAYGEGEGVQAALQLFAGGAKKVYAYRPQGSGAVKGTTSIGECPLTAKYYGSKALKVKIQEKLGNKDKKEVVVLSGTTQLEKFEFDANLSNETANLAAVLKDSKYVEFTAVESTTLTVGEYELTGGTDGTIVATDYVKGFEALEPYRYNVLTTDSIDTTVIESLKAYVKEADRAGKLLMTVIGDASTTEFATRLALAKACNDKKVVYFGSGFTDANGEVIDGARAINYVAGVIASTPSNRSIVHTEVTVATDLTEKLTNAQYEDAIKNGLLLLAIGPDGQIWFDSGINTLTAPAENEDDGWKKIKRTKVRTELFDRIDRVTAPLVGKINCDTDGIAAVIQAGMGVITSMIAEKKIMPGATMVEDPENPHVGDSAWFVIQADDIDALEKIYLHYQFRYSQNA